MPDLTGGWWDGKVAVVTGAAHGIGRAVVSRLHLLGATVVLVDIDEAGLEAAIGDLGEPASRALAVPGDISQRHAVEAIAERMDHTFGGVDFLVNCAYTNRQVRFLDIVDDYWDQVIGVNLKGTLLMGQAMARLMVSHGVSGRIVNFTSGAARVARPGFTAYGVSKAGVTHLTRYMAIELAPHGILVTAVNPGLTASEWVASYERDPENATEHAYKMSRIPLRRMGECEEAARVVTYLLGPEAGFLTGSVVVSDGGGAVSAPAG